MPIVLLGKLLLFLIAFSLSFFLLRTSATYQSFLAVDLNGLGGVPWLYSVVGLIFSILAAFVITPSISSTNLSTFDQPPKNRDA